MKHRGDAWDPTVPPEQNIYNWTERPRVQPASAPANGAPRMLDVFSGCGGLSFGLRNAGLQSALAIDIHEPSIETYRFNHPEAATILGDIKSVSTEMVLDALGGSEIVAAVAGGPCQGFSLCNRKQFDRDPRNRLFVHFMRIVHAARPQFVLFENVQNITRVADGKFARLIEEHFEELGYSVVSGPVNALDYGVPQKRIRWIFFGVRGLGKKVPWPLGDSRGLPPLTVYDAIGDLPRLKNGQGVTCYDRIPDRTYQCEMRKGAHTLVNHVAPHHPKATAERIRRTKPGEPMYDSFRQRIRLSWDQPSPTQVSGGIRPQFQFGHPGQPRGLSIRERCRIQSFPDTFQVDGGLVQGRVQTGNAVPPRIAEGFGRAMMSLLTGEHRIELREMTKNDQLQLIAQA